MTGAEYAAVNAAATGELHACAAQMSVWLLTFLRIALGGWLILAGAWLLTRIAGRHFVIRLALVLLLLLSQTVLAKSPSKVRPLSRSTAADWTVGSTLIPIMSGLALVGIAKDNHAVGCMGSYAFLGGFVLGPAAGHAYARQADRCLVGVMVRGVSLGLMLSSSTNDGAGILGTVGVFGFLISFGYDLGTVGRSVDKFNYSHGFSDVRVRPCYFAEAGAAGFNVSMSF
jgi:hypothetical protein